jgi:hypothetical protein
MSVSQIFEGMIVKTPRGDLIRVFQRHPFGWLTVGSIDGTRQWSKQTRIMRDEIESGKYTPQIADE